MSASDPVREPYFVDDETCDLCDEVALPHDALNDYPWCVEHSMEMWTDASVEDFYIDAEFEEMVEEHSVRAWTGIPERDDCFSPDNDCDGPLVPRVRKETSDFIASLTYCTVHAQQRYTDLTEPLTLEAWLPTCEPGYVDEDYCCE